MNQRYEYILDAGMIGRDRPFAVLWRGKRQSHGRSLVDFARLYVRNDCANDPVNDQGTRIIVCSGLKVLLLPYIRI